MKNQIPHITLTAVSICLITGSSVLAGWSFGVLGDNQQGSKPRFTESAISAIMQQFIEKRVKFVIQVGDQINMGGDLKERALLSQPLYDAGIGYFPLRGNHEAFTDNNTVDFRSVFPQTQGLSKTFGAVNFSSPSLSGDFPDDLKGLSYSFDYRTPCGSARFVLLDTWYTENRKIVVPGIEGYPVGYTIGEQQQWIDERLDRTTRYTEHAFVFAHQNLIPEYHWDCLFSGLSNDNIAMQNDFFKSLSWNGVKYFTSGHEHVHNRSLITSPDGNYIIQDLNCVSGGAKFLDPKPVESVKFFDQKIRQMQISQERNNIGFYIYTIDGPLVTVDYYSDSCGGFSNEPDFPYPGVSEVTYHFIKKETFGYSLTGKDFIIPQGSSYSVIADNFFGTTARILSGTNDCDATDFENRPLTKLITTNWVLRYHPKLRSPVLTLSGMADFGTDKTDIYALEMSFHTNVCSHFKTGIIGIAVQNRDGKWVNAVDGNYGGIKRFIPGQWKADYQLGTYGMDPCTKTVWAVLNYTGNFAIVNNSESLGTHPPPAHRDRHGIYPFK